MTEQAGGLAGKVAVVAGATRGCGRAIAVELGRQGATVFVAGRSTTQNRSPMGRSETIEGTAEMVDAAGGKGVAIRCDFNSVADVDALRRRLEAEAAGRLDVLVDDVWGGDPFVDFESNYWESDLDAALGVVRNGVETHLITLHRLLPLVVSSQGIAIEVTDGENDDYVGAGIPYYLVKCSVRAIGRALGAELAKHGCTGLTVTPGFLRSEAMLDHFGVTEANWRDAVTNPNIPEGSDFAVSETPYYLARSVAALVTDPNIARFAGRTLASWTLMHEYGTTDLDGTRPDFGRWMRDVRLPGLDPATTDPTPFR